MNYLKSFFEIKNIELYILGVLALFIIAFLIVQSILNRKSRIKMMKAQETLFIKASELLAKNLIDYTDSTLVNKVNANYKTLISKDLLPSVNEAAKVITDLSETVVKRQEMGMSDLAEKLAELFTSKTQEYIDNQSVVVSSVNDTVTMFSDKLTDISDIITQISFKYNDIYERANNVSTTVSQAVEYLGSNITELGVMLENAAQSAEKIQGCIIEGGDVVNSITQAAVEMHKTATESVESLASQNEKISMLLSDAVNTMEQNTEIAAKSVLAEFSTSLSSTGTLIEDNVSALQEIAGNISDTASQFANGISSSYDQFNTASDQRLELITKTVSESAEQEYKKIIDSAQTYSDNFSRNISALSEALEGHITNLQTITNHLGNSVDSFKNDVDSSSDRFELGIDKTVSAALNQMDSSLAEIVNRLVDVTASIAEAADALPKAIKSIK